MIEPADFYSNPATLADNSYQQAAAGSAQDSALKEFLSLRQLLENEGVTVRTFKDLPANGTPDSIFPNNWLSTHEEGRFVIYPMKAENRRRERRNDIISQLHNNYPDLVDLSDYENQGKFLEGTGSMVIDRNNEIVYACLSQRTHIDVLSEWTRIFNYKAVTFAAFCQKGNAIYHTNVMMALGSGFAVVCLEAIRDKYERQTLLRSLNDNGHEVVEISQEQVKSYCGNLLEVRNNKGETLLPMSTQAYNGFTDNQRYILGRYARIIHSPVDTIEKFGGGSTRCMLCELF